MSKEELKAQQQCPAEWADELAKHRLKIQMEHEQRQREMEAMVAAHKAAENESRRRDLFERVAVALVPGCSAMDDWSYLEDTALAITKRILAAAESFAKDGGKEK